MRGASRASLAEANERLSAVLASGADAVQLGDELFSVADLLDSESALRRTLSDPSLPAAAKAGLAEALLSGKVAAATLELTTGLVRAHWSAPGDLADAAEQLAVQAIVANPDAVSALLGSTTAEQAILAAPDIYPDVAEHRRD